MCKNQELAQKSGQISHQVDGSIVNLLYKPSQDMPDSFKKSSVQKCLKVSYVSDKILEKNLDIKLLISENLLI